MKTDMELRQERDAHRKAARQIGKQLRGRSRKAHGLPQRKKGMGCRIGDRDDALKAARGYTDPSTYVRRDGSEKLVGADWKKRCAELAERSGGRCEMDSVIETSHVHACDGRATEPHHIVKRSTRRNDEMGNLAHLSHPCHAVLDPRKISSGKVGA